ncbi:unnamed protein product [Periconia digitata]|uniref:Uncharacterized protein n=1 Tax=Periconia digitata TaxID=1303443 RepID=A0A9W4U7L2_9PLEO|nr:unnamed protein product [Periconia digitata]
MASLLKTCGSLIASKTTNSQVSAWLRLTRTLDPRRNPAVHVYMSLTSPTYVCLYIHIH